MNIATSLNRKYINYTIVMLTSLGVNNPVHIDAYILHGELTKNDFEYMERMLANYDITLISMPIDAGLFDQRILRTDLWSVEAYYRLLLLDLLPLEVERILYLDVDMIVNRNIEEFYRVEFEEDEIIACIDSCGVEWEKRTEKQQEMFSRMIAAGYQYFNSGVMMLNIEKMRQRYNFEKYCQAMEEWNYEMSAPDQDILNYIHWEKVAYVDYAEYDLFARIAHNEGLTYDMVKEQVAIIHFAGDKPWNTSNVHFDIEQLWWDYAKLTPCYDVLLSEFMDDLFLNARLENRIGLLLEEQQNRIKKIQEITAINKKILEVLEKKSAEVREDKYQISREYLNAVSSDPGNSAVISQKSINEKYDIVVVVPCYNEESYIEQCVDSILTQETSASVFVKIVNDGSTDRTGEILKKYEDLPNVMVITQENRGFSGARNRALETLESRWILFVDADDYLPVGAIDHLFQVATESEVDIVDGDFYFLVNGQCVLDVKRSKGNISGYMCGKMIRTELFSRIQLPEGYWFEDTIVSMLLLPQAHTTKILNVPVYVYRQNEKGISSKSQGNVKSIDTYWITEQMLRDRDKMGFAIDHDTYEMLLDQIILNYVRTYDLEENVRLAIFYLTEQWFAPLQKQFQTDDEYKRIVEKAINLCDFTTYQKACELAWTRS